MLGVKELVKPKKEQILSKTRFWKMKRVTVYSECFPDLATWEYFSWNVGSNDFAFDGIGPPMTKQNKKLWNHVGTSCYLSSLLKTYLQIGQNFVFRLEFVFFFLTRMENREIWKVIRDFWRRNFIDPRGASPVIFYFGVWTIIVRKNLEFNMCHVKFLKISRNIKMLLCFKKWSDFKAKTKLFTSFFASWFKQLNSKLTVQFDGVRNSPRRCFFLIHRRYFSFDLQNPEWLWMLCI